MNVLHLEAFLYGALRPSPRDYSVVASALNVQFVELGGNHHVAYSQEDNDTLEGDVP